MADTAKAETMRLEGKMAKKKAETETVYRLVNRDKTKAGVISHAPNCGYTDAELKSLAARGWKIKVEVRAV